MIVQIFLSGLLAFQCVNFTQSKRILNKVFFDRQDGCKEFTQYLGSNYTPNFIMSSQCLMKNIEVEPDLYQFIASQTQHIGENASQILRRLLAPQMELAKKNSNNAEVVERSAKEAKTAVVESKTAQSNKPKKAAVKKGSHDGLLNKSLLTALKEKKSKVDVFLLLLAEMNEQRTSGFNQVLDIKGSNRAYFAADKQTLLNSGKSTNPKQIPGSEYWVVTNNNTQRKSDLLCKVATVLGYAEHEVKALSAIL